MARANSDIRLMARRHGVRHWQISAELGIHDSAFSRKMRKELSEEEKEEVFNIITRLADEMYGQEEIS
jgi:hypothetical protein